MKKGLLITVGLFLAVSLALIVSAIPALAAEPQPVITLKHAEAFPAVGFYYPHLLWRRDQVERRTQAGSQSSNTLAGPSRDGRKRCRHSRAAWLI